MSDITQRSNPLADAHARLAAMNADYAPRASGGTGVPLQATGGTVLPPDPVNIEDEAAMAEAYNQQWGHYPPGYRIEAKSLGMQVHALDGPVPGVVNGAGIRNFHSIDLLSGLVVADDGSTYPLQPEEHKSALGFAFQVVRRVLGQRLEALAKQLGLVAEPQEGAPDGSVEAGVSGVPQRQTAGEVQEG